MERERKMPPSKNDDTDDEDFAVLRQKMTDHDRIIMMHGELIHIKKKQNEMAERIVYTDTCAAHRTAEDARAVRTENDVKELKDGNRFGITTGIAVVSIILAAVAIIAAVIQTLVH